MTCTVDITSDVYVYDTVTDMDEFLREWCVSEEAILKKKEDGGKYNVINETQFEIQIATFYISFTVFYNVANLKFCEDHVIYFTGKK